MGIVSEKNIDKLCYLCAIGVAAVLIFSTGGLFIAKKINTQKIDLAEIEQGLVFQQTGTVPYKLPSVENSGGGQSNTGTELEHQPDNLIDEIISEKKAELSREIRNDIIILCILFIAAAAIGLMVAYYYLREVHDIFKGYRHVQLAQIDTIEKLNQSLEKQRQVDVLTRIFNRRFFDMQLAKEAARSTRHRTPLSALLFDIDYFKSINDKHGHMQGDKVLQELSSLVHDNIRQSDVLARWGGEEFALLTPGVGLKNAGKFAEKLRLLIENHEFGLDQSLTLTCSFGVSCYRAAEETSVFMQRVDQALDQAKTQGRNRCRAC